MQQSKDYLNFWAFIPSLSEGVFQEDKIPFLYPKILNNLPFYITLGVVLEGVL